MTGNRDNPLETFKNALLYEGVQQPLEGLTQIVDDAWHKNYKVNIAQQPDGKGGALNWVAGELGSGLGMLPWFIGANKLGQGIADKTLSGALDQGLQRQVAGAAIGGFMMGSALQPTEGKNALLGRFENGIVGSANLAALTASSFGFSKLADTAAVQKVGLSWVLSRPLVAGALSGIPAAVAGTELSLYFQSGRLASGSDLTQSIGGMALVGGVMGGLHESSSTRENSALTVRTQKAATGAGDKNPGAYQLLNSMRADANVKTMLEERPVDLKPLARLGQPEKSAAPDLSFHPQDADTWQTVKNGWADLSTAHKLGALAHISEAPEGAASLIYLDALHSDSPAQVRLAAAAQTANLPVRGWLQGDLWGRAYDINNAAVTESPVLETLLEQLPKMNSDARLEAIAKLQGIIDGKGGQQKDAPVVRDLAKYADRLESPVQADSTIERHLGKDQQPTAFTFRATEYKVAGRTTKLVLGEDIPAALRATDFSGSSREAHSRIYNTLPDNVPKPEDFVAMVDNFPDSRLVPNVIVPPKTVADQMNWNDGKASGDTAGDTGKFFDHIGVYYYDNNTFLEKVMQHEWAHRLDYAGTSNADSTDFETAAFIESRKYNYRPYSNKSVGEQWAVHLGEGFLGSRLEFLETAWAAPIRSSVMARVLANNLDSVPESMRSSQHDEYVRRVQYVAEHVVPEARRQVAENVGSLPAGVSQADTINLMRSLGGGDQSVFSLLQGLNNPVRQLRITPDMQISSQDWQNLPKLSELTDLTVERPDSFGPDDVAHLPRSLTSLTVEAGKIEPGTINALSELPELASLRIRGSMSEDELNQLPNLPIKNLDISYPYIYRPIGATLKAMPNLAELHVTARAFSDDAFADVTGLKSLSIALDDAYEPYELPSMDKLPSSLESFTIQAPRTPASSIGALAKLPNLQNLSVKGYLDHDGYDQLANLQALTSFAVHSPRIDGPSVEKLAAIPRLGELHLKSVQLWDEAFTALPKLTNLKSLTLEGYSLPSYAHSQLDKMPWLDVRDVIDHNQAE